jgi:MoaA/NifB/PqqE/SkfB family radical SAM enzyme
MNNKMSEEKQAYDAMLNWNISINEKCNLNCSYCFKNLPKKKSEITKKIMSIYRRGYSAIMKALNCYIIERTMGIQPKINIKALLETLEKTKKIFKIYFTSGEPFLVTNMVETSVALTRKHYICFNTNLSLRAVRDFAFRVNPKKVLSIVASFHIKELKRRNLLNVYVENFLLLKEKGFKIEALEVAYPPHKTEVKKYKAFLQNYGIELKFNPFIGMYNGKTYPGSYSDEELELFGATKKEWVDLFHQKGELCNAGYNVAQVDAFGIVESCPQMQKKIGHIYKGINFENKMLRCPFDFCVCPLKTCDQHLFEKALEETNMCIA